MTLTNPVSKVALSARTDLISLWVQLVCDFLCLQRVWLHLCEIGTSFASTCLVSIFEWIEITSNFLHQTTRNRSSAAYNHVTLFVTKLRRTLTETLVKIDNYTTQAATNLSSNRKYTVLTSFHSFWKVIYLLYLAIILYFAHFACFIASALFFKLIRFHQLI